MEDHTNSTQRVTSQVMTAMGFAMLALAFASIFITELERLEVPPLVIAFYRMAIATAILLPPALAFKWKEIVSLARKDLGLLWRVFVVPFDMGADGRRSACSLQRRGVGIPGSTRNRADDNWTYRVQLGSQARAPNGNIIGLSGRAGRRQRARADLLRAASAVRNLCWRRTGACRRLSYNVKRAVRPG